MTDSVVTNLYISTRDNCFEEKDWSIAQLTVDDTGRIEEVTIIKEGLHGDSYEFGLCDFPDKYGTLADLQKWLDYDDTGNHPEIYHTLVSKEDVDRIMNATKLYDDRLNYTIAVFRRIHPELINTFLNFDQDAMTKLMSEIEGCRTRHVIPEQTAAYIQNIYWNLLVIS